jgi:hypothetical protein
MKKIILLLILAGITGSAFAQGGWTNPNPGAYGARAHRLSADSTLFFPTGCGAPILHGYNLKMSAVYYDSCAGKMYAFDPSGAGAWAQVGSGSGGGADTSIYTFDGRLVGNRIVNVGNHNLTFDSLASFNLKGLLSGVPTDSVMVINPTTGRVRYRSFPSVGVKLVTGGFGINVNNTDNTIPVVSADTSQIKTVADAKNDSLALAALANSKVTNVFRKAGTDSLFQTINSVNYFVSIIDTSVGGGTIVGVNANAPLSASGTTTRIISADTSFHNGALSTYFQHYQDSMQIAANTAALTAKKNITDSTNAITGYTTLYQNSLKQNKVTLTTTGSSGAATFNQGTGAFNIPQYSGGSGGVQPLTTLGTLYDSTSWNNLSGFTIVGSPTTSVSSNKINVSAGNQSISATVGATNSAFNQVLKVTSYGGTMLSKNKVTMKFKVNVSPGATTYGVGVGTYSINTGSVISNSIAYFNMSTGTGTGTVSILAGTTNTTAAKSGTALSFSQNDYIVLTYEIIGGNVFATARNQTTNSSPVTCTYSYDMRVSTDPFMPNTSNFGVVNLGGAYIIDSLNIVSNEAKNTNVMFVGDSKLQGYNSGWDVSIPSLFGRYYSGTSLSSGGGDRTQDVLNHLPEIITLAPKTVVLCIGRNDIAGAVPSGTWQANIASIVSQLQAANIRVRVLDAIYETNLNQSALISYVSTTYPSLYIGTYAPGNVAGTVASDGTHPSFLGSKIVANVIYNSGMITDSAKYLNSKPDGFVTTNSFDSVEVYGKLKADKDILVNGLTFGLGKGQVASNQAIGLNALATNTSGDYNTGVGYYTLSANTTGGHNAAGGVLALWQNTTANNNTAFGSESLFSNTVSGDNTGVGFQSLYLTTGAYNTAVGSLALKTNNTGNHNTSIGERSSFATTTGIYNTVAGSQSLYSNNTGSQNTALGGLAMYSTTTGSNNTGVGYFAGLSNTTGGNNTYLGVNAGYTDGVVTTGANLSNSTAIGYNAQVTASNSMVLGGTGSSAVNVGIGNTAPSSRLTVSGNIEMSTAGNKLIIATGSNASVGTATLSGGTVTVNTTAVTASSKIFLTDATTGALTNIGVPTVGTITAGTSFVINSSNVLDNSNINWFIIN